MPTPGRRPVGKLDCLPRAVDYCILMGTVMRDDTSWRSHRLAVTQPVHSCYHHYPFTENCCLPLWNPLTLATPYGYIPQREVENCV